MDGQQQRHRHAGGSRRRPVALIGFGGLCFLACFRGPAVSNFDSRPRWSNEAQEEIMEWTTPQFEEVSLNCEINSYAKAEL
jgi:coenzyme PQQ precursor peptide PqqA